MVSLSYTKNDIRRYHERVIHFARRDLQRALIDRAMSRLAVAAKLAYNFNIFYREEHSEELLHDISRCLFEPVEVGGGENRYVLIDTNGADNCGLTQQYLRAMMAQGVDILYIYEDPDHSRIRDILEELKAYDRATVCLFDEMRPTECAKKIMGEIIRFAPSKIFLHIMPWDVPALAVCAALRGVTIYNINLTDHAYWLGASVIDYNIEFRDYGATVSTSKRGLKPEQLLMMPYYPIINLKEQFVGFPSQAEGKIVILSGGSFYKIYGQNKIYFRIVERLMRENPQAVLLYMGEWSDGEPFSEFVKKEKLEQRVVFLGYRKDVAQAINNCDIYLGTYPLTGGLMTQYAATLAKPILAHARQGDYCSYVESLVGDCEPITRTDLDEFFKYGQELCRDAALRKETGDRLSKAMTTPRQFNERFVEIEKRVVDNPGNMSIDYEGFRDYYLEIENCYRPMAAVLLVRNFGFRSLWLFPKASINALPAIMRKIVRR